MRWQALHTKLVRSTGTLSFQKRFETDQQDSDRLHRFSDPAALLDHLHAPEGDAAERNTILRNLVAAAQAGPGDCAATLVLLALWPGLDAVHGRLTRHDRCGPQDLAAEIAGRAVIGIAALDLDRVQWIAATLIRSVERDIRRALQASWAETALRAEVSNDVAHEEQPSSCSAEGASAALLRRDLRRLIGTDADLLLSVALVGETQQEAGARLGIGPEAARKRLQRARLRLRARLAEIA